MKKIIYSCAFNVLLSVLFGLAFMFPFSNVQQTENGVSFNITVFPILLLVYLLLYPVVRYFLKRKFDLVKDFDSELTFADEREKIIVSESTKTAYQVLIGGLITTITFIGGVRFFALFAHININIYFICVLLLTILLIVAIISYCVKWCCEYRK